MNGELERLARRHLPEPDGLDRACRHALLAPGKRVRPVLLTLVAQLFRVPAERVVRLGTVIELVHCASLVLDDLPCMDDADTRRGLPSLHRAFGEATAILAAFRLLSTAHGILPEALEHARVPRARRAGEDRMLAAVVDRLCQGQQLDLAADASSVDELERVHASKTGALFELAARWGALAGRPSAAEEEAVLDYARNLGLAFQVVDDVLDVTGDAEEMGKPADQDAGRVTFVRLLGVGGSRRLASELVEAAQGAVEVFGARAEPLRELARGVVDRAS